MNKIFTKSNTKIIFLGTPDFATVALNCLIENEFQIVAVVTAPDKPAGRGLQLQASAVKKYALEKNIPVLQPEKLKSELFIKELESYKADLQVVVAFRMLPEIVWNMPPLGTINIHGSLLPKYRGAAPINWAIINGEIETGVTTFKLQHEIDTGDILLSDSVSIVPEMTAGELHDILAQKGAALIVKTLDDILAGCSQPIPQKVVDSTPHAPKIFTETCRIDWTQSVDVVHNHIRGLSPFPTAFCTIQNKKVKIFRARKQKEEKMSIGIGQYETDEKTFLRFACIDGFIEILELQMEGKKRMLIAEFLRGNKL